MDTIADLDGRSRYSFAHLGLCYDDLGEYVAGVVPFIENALAALSPVMVAVPGERLDLIRDHLGTTADDALLADMTVAGRNPGWILPGVLLEFANCHPDQPVSMVGEPVWPGRSDEEYPACVVHEALINKAFAGRDGAMLCPYDAMNLETDGVSGTHGEKVVHRRSQLIVENREPGNETGTIGRHRTTDTGLYQLEQPHRVVIPGLGQSALAT